MGSLVLELRRETRSLKLLEESYLCSCISSIHVTKHRFLSTNFPWLSNILIQLSASIRAPNSRNIFMVHTRMEARLEFSERGFKSWMKRVKEVMQQERSCRG